MRFSIGGARLLACLVIIAGATAAFACGDDDYGDNNGEPAAASATPSGPPDKVTFMLGFRPQANLPFVGGFVAKEKAFFAARNLDVSIVPSNGGQHLQLLAAGEVQFTTADAANVIQRALDPGLPITSIALIGQTGQQAWVTLKSSGLDSVASWQGKTVAYRNTVPPDLDALLQENGLTRDDVTLVDIKFDPPTLLVEGRVDAYPVFLSNEPDTITRKLGQEINVFRAADFDVPTLGLAYVATRDYVEEHADIAARFLAAVLEGIEYAREHPDEAVEIVLKSAPQEEREHQRFILDTELEASRLGAAAEGGTGWQTDAQWRALYDTLVQYDAVDGSKGFPEGVFTTSVLVEAAKR